MSAPCPTPGPGCTLSLISLKKKVHYCAVAMVGDAFGGARRQERLSWHRTGREESLDEGTGARGTTHRGEGDLELEWFTPTENLPS